MESHCPANFDGHSHCGIADIMVLVYPIIPQDQVIKGSCDFMGWSSLRKVNILLSSVATGFGIVEI